MDDKNRQTRTLDCGIILTMKRENNTILSVLFLDRAHTEFAINVMNDIINTNEQRANGKHMHI